MVRPGQVAAVAAAVFEILAAVGVNHLGPLQLLPFGLFFLALALAVP